MALLSPLHDTELATKVYAAAAAGLAAHNLYFIRGEHHLAAPAIFIGAISLSILTFGFEYYCSPAHAVFNAGVIIGAFNATLFASITVYRTLLHPLRSFPGPFGAKVSKLWHSFHILDSRNHMFLHELHAKYGPVVRTGPGELSIFDPEVFTVVAGPGTTCIKAPWYDMLYPLVALNSIREREGYAPRRKLWDDAFKPKVLRQRKDQDVILAYALSLAEHIENLETPSINMHKWFGFLSFDVMGDFAFATSFNMLKTGKWDEGVKLVRDGMDILGPLSPVPWLAQIGFLLPWAAQSWKQMLAWCTNIMTERLALDVSKPDVSYWLIEAQRNRPENMDMKDIFGDAIAVVIAGSHTTASSLTYIFYHLAADPRSQALLREELRTVVSIHDYEQIMELPYLNAVLNESLRLHPVLPTAGVRQTTADGVMVAGQYIPPYTTIVTPRYTMARLESCFERAEEFIPERWTTKPELVRDRRAFQPFNLGRHSCPGKNIGLMELRVVTAVLVDKFDVSFAVGEDGKTVLEKMRDTFTQQPGDLYLAFKPAGKSPAMPDSTM